MKLKMCVIQVWVKIGNRSLINLSVCYLYANWIRSYLTKNNSHIFKQKQLSEQRYNSEVFVLKVKLEVSPFNGASSVADAIIGPYCNCRYLSNKRHELFPRSNIYGKIWHHLWSVIIKVLSHLHAKTFLKEVYLNDTQKRLALIVFTLCYFKCFRSN